MNKYFLIFFVSILLASCSNKDEVVYMQSLDGVWNKKKELKFEFNVEETSPKNIVLVVRNNNDYPYSNLFVKAYVKAESDKNFKVDTLNYILAKPNGEWIGSGFGETKEILFLYKNNYTFPKKGKYIIGITQAMRTNDLKGIKNVEKKIQNKTKQ